MKNIFKIISVLALISLFSCQDYLETDPDSSLSVDVDTEEKIAELLTAAYPEASYMSFLEARTDNVEERINGDHYRMNEAMFFWEDYDQEDIDTPLHYWNACYAGIAQANKALELLANLPKNKRVNALYGEALLVRAYLHFMLVNIWAEPYSEQKSKTDLGIPYIEKPEKHALVDYKRETVEKVYEKIERDLKLGVSLVDDGYYNVPKFHFNKKAAYAFASRFYLIKGEWDKVIAYSDYVLGGDTNNILRNWQPYLNLTEFDLNRENLWKVYTSPQASSNLMLTTTESRLKRRIAKEKYGASFNTINKIFNKNGIEGCPEAKKLNLEAFYPFNVSALPIKNGMYLAKFDEIAMFGSGGYNPRNIHVTNVLFTTDEVLLNRAEAYAMSQEYDASIDDLLLYIKAKYGITLPCSRDMFLSTSGDNYNLYTPFYGLTIRQLSLIKIITEFRQKEFIHEGLRWFDIRRFHLPITRKSRNSIYRPLEKDDYRKVLQIPVEAINRGLEPNPR